MAFLPAIGNEKTLNPIFFFKVPLTLLSLLGSFHTKLSLSQEVLLPSDLKGFLYDQGLNTLSHTHQWCSVVPQSQSQVRK